MIYKKDAERDRLKDQGRELYEKNRSNQEST